MTTMDDLKKLIEKLNSNAIGIGTSMSSVKKRLSDLSEKMELLKKEVNALKLQECK